MTANYCLIQNGATSGTLTGARQSNGRRSRLGTINYYGGPTATVPLLPDSPAIDMGDNDLAVDADGVPLSD